MRLKSREFRCLIRRWNENWGSPLLIYSQSHGRLSVTSPLNTYYFREFRGDEAKTCVNRIQFQTISGGIETYVTYKTHEVEAKTDVLHRPRPKPHYPDEAEAFKFFGFFEVQAFEANLTSLILYSQHSK